MVLVPCPECRQQVSSQAATCPHCGIAIADAPRFPAPPPASPTPERTLWEGHPSLMVLLRQAIVTVILALGLPALAYFAWDRAIGGLPPGARKVDGLDRGVVAMVVAAAVALLVLYRVAALVWAGLRVRSVHYRVTNQRIVVESGLLAKALQEIDLRYLEDVSFSQSLFERLLGLGQVLVISSDTQAPRLSMTGIKDPRGLRELIRTHAFAASQRQLFTRAT